MTRSHYIDNVQVALHYVNLMAYEARGSEQTLSLHNGVVTRTLSIIKPFALKLGQLIFIRDTGQ